MTNDFHLFDLVAQADAVNRLLSDLAEAERASWLATKGELSVITQLGETKAYRFVSAVGIEATFFFRESRMVFVGDHTTFAS